MATSVTEDKSQFYKNLLKIAAEENVAPNVMKSLENITETAMNNDCNFEQLLFTTAINKNQIGIMKCALQAGIDPNTTLNAEGDTPLHKAVQLVGSGFEFCELLIKFNAAVNSVNEKGETPIFNALRCQNPHDDKFAIVQYLIASGAYTHIQDSVILDTPLMTYIFCASSSPEYFGGLSQIIEMMNLLLSSGGHQSINACSIFGTTLLQIVVQNLPNIVGLDESEFENPIYRDAAKGILSTLIKHGADPNAFNNVGRTALHFAARNLDMPTIHILVDMGADVSCKTKVGHSIIYELCLQPLDDCHEFGEIFQQLVDLGCNINDEAADKSTALHFAAVRHTPKVCSALIAAGATATMDARDYLGRTPLHLAARNPDETVAKILISHNAEVDSRDVYNYTPLHYAALFENLSTFDILLQYGASPHANGNLSVTPFHMAGERGCVEMITCLLKGGGNPNVSDQYSATPLYYAACDGNYEVIEALLKAGASKDHEDVKGRKPLWHALLMGHGKAASYLAPDGDQVMYGQLPVFPNRPLLEPDALANCFQATTDAMKSIGTSHDIEAAIMNTRGLGNIGQEESEQVTRSLEDFVMALLERIGHVDQRFVGTIIKSGSSYEGVKVGHPDEYDFMCSLTNFSQLVKELEYVDSAGFVKPKVVKDHIAQEYGEFITESGHLDYSTVLHQFTKLLLEAEYYLGGAGHLNLYRGVLLSDEIESYYFDNTFAQERLPSFNVTWRGKDYKALDVSVDVTPAIFVPTWPSSARKYSNIIGDLTGRGVFIVPKFPKRSFSKSSRQWKASTSKQEASTWRLSFSHVEHEIMNAIPDYLKQGYRLAKCFRLEPLSCPIKLQHEIEVKTVADFQQLQKESSEEDEYSSYEETVNDLGGGTDGSSMVETPEDSGASSDEATMDDGDSRTREASGCGAYQENEMSGDNECAVDLPFQINDGNIFLEHSSKSNEDLLQDDNRTHVVINLYGDDDSPQYELSGEEAITSYHLKNIFLNEADKLRGSKKAETLLKPYQLCCIIYEKLLSSDTDGKLFSYFLPNHNLYYYKTYSTHHPGLMTDWKEAQNYRKLPKPTNATKVYCSHILKMMEDLGFMT